MGATIEPVEEGVTGAVAGGIAGAYLTKNPRGAMTGAKLGSNLQNKYADYKKKKEQEKVEPNVDDYLDEK